MKNYCDNCYSPVPDRATWCPGCGVLVYRKQEGEGCPMPVVGCGVSLVAGIFLWNLVTYPFVQLLRAILPPELIAALPGWVLGLPGNVWGSIGTALVIWLGLALLTSFDRNG